MDDPLPPPVVVVAASAGGVEALTRFVGALPGDLPAAVLVVLHLPASGPSVLPSILGRAGFLPVSHAEDGAPLVAGRILVAPPGQHLQVDDGRAAVQAGPRLNGHRPSADALFLSAAHDLGARAAGVILSGTMDDGAAGLRAIDLAGGLALVQDPDEAAFPGMPRAALAEAPRAEACRIADIVARLASWAEATSSARPRRLVPTPGGSAMQHARLAGTDVRGTDRDDRDPGGTDPGGTDLGGTDLGGTDLGGTGLGHAHSGHADLGHADLGHADLGHAAGDVGEELSRLTCPECGGGLVVDRSLGVERFRCRVGHTFSGEHLLVGKQEALEAALWAAVVALEERADLTRRMQQRLGPGARPRQVHRYRDELARIAGQVALLRRVIDDLVERGPLTQDDEDGDGSTG